MRRKSHHALGLLHLQRPVQAGSRVRGNLRFLPEGIRYIINSLKHIDGLFNSVQALFDDIRRGGIGKSYVVISSKSIT
jgi:hypothetical protein